MKALGGHIVVQALEEEGVRYVFGIPGAHNMELYDALESSKQITPVLVTDEQSASFMADAISRSSDQVGVVNLVPGAGLTHALSGIAEAYMDNVPMVVLMCGVRNDTNDYYQLHQLDQLAIVRPVVKTTLRPQSYEDIYPMIREAFRLARKSTPGPVAIEIASNYYYFSHEFSNITYTPHDVEPPSPSEDDVKTAAKMLSNAQRPLVYVGNGCREAQDLLVKVAEKLSAPVITTIHGKGIFPEDHPLWLWNVPGNSSPPFAKKIANGCDCMLAVGCRFSELATASYGETVPEDLIHVDTDPEVFNKNHKAKLAIEADAKKFFELLLKHVVEKPEDVKLKQEMAQGHQHIWKTFRTKPNDKIVTPALLFEALQKKLGPNAIYTTDSGNSMFFAMEALRITKPGCFLGPIDFSCMGYAVPGALGAKFVNPDRPVVAIAGDGALLMTGLEILTGSSYEVAPMIFVFSDGTLAYIAKTEQTLLNRQICTDLPSYDLEAMAKMCNARYVKLQNDLEIERAIDEALEATKAKKPVLVDVNIDYSKKNIFQKGHAKTLFFKFPWSERLRLISRIVKRKMHLEHLEASSTT